jgi:hypothetical protein
MATSRSVAAHLRYPLILRDPEIFAPIDDHESQSRGHQRVEEQEDHIFPSAQGVVVARVGPSESRLDPQLGCHHAGRSLAFLSHVYGGPALPVTTSPPGSRAARRIESMHGGYAARRKPATLGTAGYVIGISARLPLLGPGPDDRPEPSDAANYDR